MRPLFPFFIALVLVLCTSCGDKDTAEGATDIIPRPIRHQTIGYAMSSGQHTYSGVAQADQLSNLSFRVGGTIRSMNVKLGDRINKGQLIATIDPADYSIQAEQANASTKGAEANVQAAETQLINARLSYQRIEKLYENNSVPLSDFEQAKSGFESAQANYDAAKTQLTSAQKQSQSAQNQVSYTRLIAPFSGIITAVQVEVNELVGSGTPIAQLSSISQPEVNIGVPENFISSIKRGQAVDIEFSALPGERFKGKVSEVSYAAGSSPTYPAIVSIDNPSEAIRPGMAATVTFQTATKDAQSLLICPIKALAKDTESTFVYVLEKGSADDYIAQRQTVEVGDILAEGFVVKSGLEEGQIVATAGLKSLLDGMVVRLAQ